MKSGWVVMRLLCSFVFIIYRIALHIPPTMTPKPPPTTRIQIAEDTADLLEQVVRATGRGHTDLIREAIRAMWWASVGSFSHPTQRKRLNPDK